MDVQEASQYNCGCSGSPSPCHPVEPASICFCLGFLFRDSEGSHLARIARSLNPIEATGMRLEVRRSRSSRSSNLFPLPLTSPQTKNLGAQRRMNVSFRGALVQLNRIDEKESEKDIQKLFLLFKNGFSCIE